MIVHLMLILKILLNHEKHEKHEKSRGDRPVALPPSREKQFSFMGAA